MRGGKHRPSLRALRAELRISVFARGRKGGARSTALAGIRPGISSQFISAPSRWKPQACSEWSRPGKSGKQLWTRNSRVFDRTTVRGVRPCSDIPNNRFRPPALRISTGKATVCEVVQRLIPKHATTAGEVSDAASVTATGRSLRRDCSSRGRRPWRSAEFRMMAAVGDVDGQADDQPHEESHPGFHGQAGHQDHAGYNR